MKRKVLVLLMTLALSVSLAACTTKETETDNKETATETVESVSESESVVEETEKTEESQSETLEDTAESESETEEVQVEDIVSALGTFDGEKYVNEQFNMTITIPADWEVMSDEEKYEVLGLGADVMGDYNDLSAAQIEQIMQSTLSLFMASDTSSISEDGVSGNVSITAEQITGTNKLIITSAEKYLDASRVYFEQIEELNGVPAKYELGDYEIVTIGGIEWAFLPAVLNVNDGALRYSQDMAVVMIDDYALLLASSYLNEEQEARIADLIANISFE